MKEEKEKQYEILKCIVLRVNRTEVPTIFNYNIGLLIDDKNNFAEEKVRKLDDKYYLEIGKTYNTSIKAKVKDIISIKFYSFNVYSNKKGKIYANVYEPTIDQLHEEELTPDTFESAKEKTKVSGVFLERFIEDLYTYNPKDVKDNSTLLDDYRILLAWYSSDIKKYSKKNIVEKLKEVIKEILTRKIATLRPDQYKNKEIRDLVKSILKEIITKGIALNSNELEEFFKEKEFCIYKTRNLTNDFDTVYWVSDQTSRKIYGAVFMERTTNNSVEKNVSLLTNIGYKLTPVVILDKLEYSEHNLGSYMLINNIKFSEKRNDIPNENKQWRFVAQLHFRGRAVHMDLRNEFGDYLKGWTILLQSYFSSEPVLSLDQARDYVKMGKAKINLITGEFRSIKTKSGIVRKTSLKAIPKADGPIEWLDVEGVIPAGKVGATVRYPGVFLIWDKGIVEYGSFKPYFYEYFYQGKKLNGRYIIYSLIHSMDEVLSLAEMPEETEVGTSQHWVIIQPDDQTPYVLSEKAVDEGYIPPFGYSFLPQKIRDTIPPDYHYWKKQRIKDRILVRNLLVKELNQFNKKQ